jgi:predicted MFS family arabinose efflux permease
MTLGVALGTPAAGLMIDRWGWQGGLLMPAAVALATVVAQAAVDRLRPSRIRPLALPERER